jgi:hypothetical protein
LTCAENSIYDEVEDLMRIEFKREGGFAYLPGLRKPVSVDSEQLSPEDAGELERLLREADFFNLRATPSAPPPGAADYQTYTLTIEDAGRRHTVQFTDAEPDPALRALVDAVKARSSQETS